MAEVMTSDLLVAGLQKNLAKKATFEEAVKRLTLIVEKEYESASPALQRQIFEAVARTSTLLQSRYTSRGFWLAGLRLFNAMEAVNKQPLECKQVQSFLNKAKEFLGEEVVRRERDASHTDVQARSTFGASTSSPYLFEGQLSSSAQPPRPSWLVAQTAHFSLLSNLHEEPQAGTRLGQPPASEEETVNGLRAMQEDLIRITGETLRQREEDTGSATVNAEMTDQEDMSTNDQSDRVVAGQDHWRAEGAESGLHENDDMVDGDANSSDGPPEQDDIGGEGHAESEALTGESGLNPAASERARLARVRLGVLLSAMRDPGEGNEPGRVPDFLEIMRAAMMEANDDEIPGLQEALQATMQDVPRGTPPASKELVASLPKVKITSEVLNGLGAETYCTVCTEMYAEGEVMQELPCKHTFHPECISPWLEMHNSCPLCRYEMRTDDDEYERNKVREKEEREERRGVDNALQQGEHMYL